MILLLVPKPNFADCYPPGIFVQNEPGEIGRNTVFVIDFYPPSKRIINWLNIIYSIYLESENDIVELEIINTINSMHNITQVFFQPASKLKNGQTYTLKISNLSDFEHRFLKWFGERGSEPKPMSWKVNNKRVITQTKWNSTPRLSNVIEEYTNGTSTAQVIFDLDYITSLPVMVKTELLDITENKSNYFYLKPYEGKVTVGYRMCVGAFTFEKRNKYKIRFSIYDFTNNSTEQWTDWVEFDSPFMISWWYSFHKMGLFGLYF